MTSKRNDIIERDRVLPGQIQSIDKDVKNTWKWSWLETEVDGIMLAEAVRKLDKPALALYLRTFPLFFHWAVACLRYKPYVLFASC